MRHLGLRRGLTAAVLAATVGILAGCGTTGPAAGARTPSITTAQVTASSAAGATAVATTTETLPTTTTPVLPGTGKPAILLGDMNTPEQFIIGALYEEALQAQGYLVELSRNIGATAVSQAAILQGSLQIYPEYLNTYVSEVAGETQRFSSTARAFAAAQRYARAHGQVLLPPTPFTDNAGIAVLTRFARAHKLRTIGDLRRVQDDLILGAPLEYLLTPTGLPTLERAYHFSPGVTAVTNLGSQYTEMREGTLNATYVQTSDWELSERRYTILADTKHVLGFGNVVPVVSAKALAIEGPAFAAAIRQVDALLTNSAIRGLAAELATSTDPAMSAGDVAQEFLQGYGIVAPPTWSTATIATPTATPTLTASGSTSTTGSTG